MGNLVWRAEILRVTKYNDGSLVSLDTSRITWNNSTTPKYCFYKNTTIIDSIKKYGALYNWHVVNPANPKKIAPTGWHVPSDAEWDTLQNHLISKGYNWDGTITGNKIAKSLAAKTDWMADTMVGTSGYDLTNNNSSGFSALPAGHRSGTGNFYSQNYDGTWWGTAKNDESRAWYRDLNYGIDSLIRGSCDLSCGFSVRLVRD
jgi:uncharacterized protein (TIGR02145 family)